MPPVLAPLFGSRGTRCPGGLRLAARGAALAWATLAGLACDPGKPTDLHSLAIVVDTHSDTTPYFQDPAWRFDQRHPASETHMDLPRIREGGLDVQFWSIYLGRRDGEGLAIREALERIDAVHEMVRRHPEQVALAGSVAEIRGAVARGKLASLMGVEGGHIIEDRLSALRMFYALGARYLTLTHSFHTNWADSSGTGDPVEPEHGGLTAFGEEVVRELNRLGMMVDVSHVSDETFWDTLRVTRAPVIASHSSCRALADHPRNMSDEMLRGLAKNGGVIMINFYPAYIDMDTNAKTSEHYTLLREELAEIRERFAGDFPGSMRASKKLYAEHPFPETSLDVLLDHFDHAIEVAGPDHVGIGADWDGVPSMPAGMGDISKLPALSDGLLARGHSRETVVKILGENLLRVMAQNERVARELD